MPLRPEDVAEMVSELVSLPDVCVQLHELVESGDYAMRDVARIISQDPAMSARLLRLANSPFYGFSTRVDTISRAVMLIGTQELRDLVVATYAVDSFARVPNDLVDTRSFWEHSVYCGIVARILAGKCRMMQKERLFLSGLLHDIGKLAMYSAIPELVEVIFARYQVWTGPLYRAEDSILGFHHGQVGAELMRLWQLPESLVAVTRQHHEPADAEAYEKETAIVHLANFIAQRAGHRDIRMDDGGELYGGVWKTLDLPDRLVDPVIDMADVQFEAVVATLLSDGHAAHSAA